MEPRYIVNKRILDNLILIIICSAYGMISLSFILNIQQASYFLFLCMGASFLSFLVLFISVRNRILNIAVLFALITLLHYLFFYGTVKIVDSLIVISVVFFATVVYVVQLSNRNFSVFVVGAVICAFVLILNANKAQYYTYQGWLQYVYMNSNTAGAVSLNLFVAMILGSNFVLKRWMKISLWGISLYMLRIIMKTSSRSSFIAAIVYLVFLVLQNRRIPKKTVEKILLLSPVIVIPIVTLFFSIWFSQNTVFLGKTLISGREYMWLDAINTVKHNIISFTNDYTSGLNSALKLSYVSGVIGVIVFFKFFLRLLDDSHQNGIESKQQYNLAMLAVGIIFLNQSFESILISGSYAVCYISMAMLGVSKRRRQR